MHSLSCGGLSQSGVVTTKGIGGGGGSLCCVKFYPYEYNIEGHNRRARSPLSTRLQTLPSCRSCCGLTQRGTVSVLSSCVDSQMHASRFHPSIRRYHRTLHRVNGIGSLSFRQSENEQFPFMLTAKIFATSLLCFDFFLSFFFFSFVSCLFACVVS